jgi:hypothetical protein
VATIFTGLASAALFGHTLTINFVLGVTIVFISMHQVGHIDPLKAYPEKNNGVNIPDVIDRNPIVAKEPSIKVQSSIPKETACRSGLLHFKAANMM